MTLIPRIPMFRFDKTLHAMGCPAGGRGLVRSLGPLAALGAGLTLAWVGSAAGDWPQFRGPRTAGVVASGEMPLDWSGDHVQWSIDLGSRDVGSPIIAGGHVYLLRSGDAQAGDDAIYLDCHDIETGELLWTHGNPLGDYVTHQRNTRAGGTPVADADHVYAAFADRLHTWLIAYDHNGQEIWRRDFGTWQSQHGFATSPTVVDDLVLLLCDQQAEELNPGETAGASRLIAVDRITGRDRWATPLVATRASYGVPAVHRTRDRTQIIAATTGNGIFAVDAADGRMLWQRRVFDKRSCASPLIHQTEDGVIAIASCGNGGGANELVAVEVPDGDEAGDAPSDSTLEPPEVYRIRRNAPYVPTPVIHRDRLWAVDDRGIASCHDVATGRRIWQQRIGGNFGASPIIIGDCMLIISLDGVATIIRVADEFERLATIDLGGPVGATPAYDDHRLVVRVDRRLMAIVP